jgi:hypothetical protein
MPPVADKDTRAVRLSWRGKEGRQRGDVLGFGFQRTQRTIGPVGEFSSGNDWWGEVGFLHRFCFHLQRLVER